MVTPLINTLRNEVPMLVRAAPSSGDFLEGVFSRKDLSRCYALLRDALGQPAKEFDQPAAFEPAVHAIVEALGGCRPEQCLFLKHDQAGRTLYAALWPWASDQTRITLKLGVCEPHAG